MKNVSVYLKSSLAAAAAIALLGSATQALGAGSFDHPSMIEVGGGVGHLGDTENPVEAVFKVEAVAASGVSAYQDFIVARISGLASAGIEGVSYIDFHMESLGWQWGDSEAFTALTFLNFDVQRNVPINNDVTLRVTFVGVRGEIDTDLSDEVAFSLKGAIDLIGIGFTRRTDTASLVGSAMGASGEVGFKFFDRFRIALGEKFGMTSGKPETYYTGYVVCEDYYDDYGYVDSYCYDETETRFRDNRLTSNTYVALTASLTENISVFGQASYNVYVVNDSTGETVNSSDGAWQFFMGVSGQF